MSKSGKKVWATVIVIIIVIAAVGVGAYYMMLPPAPPKVEKPVQLKHVSMDAGSVWHMMATAIGEVSKGYLPEGSTYDTPAIGSAVTNIIMCAKDEADFGMTFPPSIIWAIEGTYGFEKEGKVTAFRAVANYLNMYYAPIMAGKELGLTSLADIKAKKIPIKLVTIPVGTQTEVYARQLLAEYGITYADIEAWGGKRTHTALATTATLMKDRLADFWIASVTAGHPTYVDVAMSRPLTWLSIEDNVRDAMVKKYGYAKVALPKGMFAGVDKDTPILGYPSIMVCRDDLPEYVVYAVVKAMCENTEKLAKAVPAFKEFKPEDAWKDTVIPLHPGAEKYYKERGWMK